MDINEQYNECCLTEPGLLSAVASAPLSREISDVALSRPLFLAESLVADVSRDSRDLLALSDSLITRFFGGSVEDYLVALGREPRFIDAVRQCSVGELAYYGRADAIMSSGRFQIIELNVGSDLGGYAATKINRALLERPEFARFAYQRELRYVDARDVLIDRLRAEAKRVVGVDDPMVALIEESGAGGDGQKLVDSLEDRGLRIVLGELADLSVRQGKIVVHGAVQVDIVARMFFASHLLRNDGELNGARMLAEAHRNGRTALFTALDTAIHESKASLGLFHHDTIWPKLSDAERELVSRAVPRTRLFGADFPLVSREDQRDLAEECRERRTELVLKPGGREWGRGVVIGAALTDREWHDAIRVAQSGDYVIQDRVVSDPVDAVDPETRRTAPWQLVYGVFFDNTDHGGTFVRAAPRNSVQVLSGAGTCKYGCVFTHD
jgi:hypothetical protein